MRRSSILLLLALACSSSESPGSGGPLAGYKPCDPASQVGRFTIELVPARADLGTPASTQINGFIQNAVDPSQVWQVQATDGDCKLLGLPIPFCDPGCTGAKPICTTQNRCIETPPYQDIGAVTVTGLSTPVTLTKTSGLNGPTYTGSVNNPYPAYIPDAQIQLSATGGAYKAFSLLGRGIAPLNFSGAGIKVARDQPLTVRWAQTVEPSLSRIVVSLDIGHHGGIAARVECNVPDNGSATISASMINKLIEKGTAGFPSINVSRRTADSATVGPGCTEFAVASPVEQIIEVDGVISCNDNDLRCPAGRVCGRDFKCQ
jgi:hypothetical protein